MVALSAVSQQQFVDERETPQVIPAGFRVSICAVADGVFDLTGLDLYIPVHGRRREATLRVIVESITPLPITASGVPQYRALVYDEVRDTLTPYIFPAYQALAVK